MPTLRASLPLEESLSLEQSQRRQGGRGLRGRTNVNFLAERRLGSNGMAHPKMMERLPATISASYQQAQSKAAEPSKTAVVEEKVVHKQEPKPEQAPPEEPQDGEQDGDEDENDGERRRFLETDLDGEQDLVETETNSNSNSTATAVKQAESQQDSSRLSSIKAIALDQQRALKDTGTELELELELELVQEDIAEPEQATFDAEVEQAEAEANQEAFIDTGAAAIDGEGAADDGQTDGDVKQAASDGEGEEEPATLDQEGDGENEAPAMADGASLDGSMSKEAISETTDGPGHADGDADGDEHIEQQQNETFGSDFVQEATMDGETAGAVDGTVDGDGEPATLDEDVDGDGYGTVDTTGAVDGTVDGDGELATLEQDVDGTDGDWEEPATIDGTHGESDGETERGPADGEIDIVGEEEAILNGETLPANIDGDGDVDGQVQQLVDTELETIDGQIETAVGEQQAINDGEAAQSDGEMGGAIFEDGRGDEAETATEAIERLADSQEDGVLDGDEQIDTKGGIDGEAAGDVLEAVDGEGGASDGQLEVSETAQVDGGAIDGVEAAVVDGEAIVDEGGATDGGEVDGIDSDVSQLDGSATGADIDGEAQADGTTEKDVDGDGDGDGSDDDDDFVWGAPSSSSDEFDPFGDLNGDIFNVEELNSIQSSFESSEEAIEVIDQNNGGESNIFQNNQDNAVGGAGDDWMDDDNSGMGGTLFLALTIGIIAFCVMWRRNAASGQGRAGYQPVPAKAHSKKY